MTSRSWARNESQTQREDFTPVGNQKVCNKIIFSSLPLTMNNMLTNYLYEETCMAGRLFDGARRDGIKPTGGGLTGVKNVLRDL